MATRETAVKSAPDWKLPAWRWVGSRHWEQMPAAAVTPAGGAFDAPLELVQMEAQKKCFYDNARLFVRGLPANHVLLAGAPGTGKTTLVESLLRLFAHDGLRLLYLDVDDLIDLPWITQSLAGRPERFVLFCDDVPAVLPGREQRYLKAAMSQAGLLSNMLFCFAATCTVPDQAEQELGSGLPCAPLPRETLPMAECFGLWLSFPAMTQEEYLLLAQRALRLCGVPEQEADCGDARMAALEFADHRGEANGRTAWQFARAYAGHLALKDG